jgi:hypothetical protein
MQERGGRGSRAGALFLIVHFDSKRRLGSGAWYRWAEVSKNLVTAPEGGYDLAREGIGTRVTIYNVLEGHGPGKLIAPLALRSARKGADDFGKAIKSAVEAS